MQPLFEHRRGFAGFESRVLELEGEGPPLVLLHGWADSADTWRHLLAAAGRGDRRAIAVDFPGFGAADPLEPGPVLPQLDRFAEAVIEYAAQDGHDVVLAGNSLGGVVALRSAQRVALAGVAPVAPAGLDMPRWFDLVERDPILRRLLALPIPVPELALRETVGRMYRALAFAHPAAVDQKVVSAFTGHHRDRAAVRRMLDAGRRVLPELDDCFDFARVRCPVLLVWGVRDRMVSPRGAQRVLEALPTTRVELIEDCGHCPQIEAPARLARLLLAFPDRGLAAAA
ncbi:MAG: alpha/beta fold hydrolase [Actinomycetota bacterium]|nr:alpha/beta fold hydrolase [Actinomycetota bacterium]